MKYLLFSVVSGRARLELRCHGSGQIIFIYIYNNVCLWNYGYIFERPVLVRSQGGLDQSEL